MTHHLPDIAISVRQPWAWAIFNGKDVENRTGHSTVLHVKKKVPFRVAVHAAKGMTRNEYEYAHEFMRRIGTDCPPPDELVRGAILGAVTVRAAITASASPWFFGPHALCLENPEPCEPVPASGALGYFKWKETGALDEPKPWMKSWHDGVTGQPIRRTPGGATTRDLFEETAP